MPSENPSAPPTPQPSASRPSVPVATRRKVRLFVAITLYVLWTAFIAYLALGGKEAVVVSRPQMLAAPLVVEADVSESAGDVRPVRIVRVYRGQQMLSGLARPNEERLSVRVSGFEQARGWQGPGTYILALQRGHEDSFALVPLPMSPGFPPPGRADQMRPLIYPATPSVRRQTEEAVRLAPDNP